LFEDRQLIFDHDLFIWKKKAPSVFSWVGEQEGQIEAHYCIIELPLWNGIRTGFAVDAIFSKKAGTIPDISGICNHALQVAKAAGLDVVIGFPNERMAPIRKMLGWKSAPSYRWEVSKGISPINGTYDMRELAIKSEYESWRWGQCPRSYLATDNGQFIIAAQDGLNESIPILLRYEKESWQTNYQTHYFSFIEKVNDEQYSDIKRIEPLYFWLGNDGMQHTLSWPKVWPLETVEGVTLGW
jgi:hypothetical protein